MKRIINKIRNEQGQALPIILILMVIGGLIIAPLLSYVSSGLLVGQTYEAMADELYAADAGVEDGLWQITYNHLDELFSSQGYDPYDYATEYDYPASYPVVVNGMDVDVTIENVWVPDIGEPDVDEANQLIGAGKLIITGNVVEDPVEGKKQQTKIYYYQDDDDGELQINTIGIWIPPGFNYDETGECTLETYLDGNPSADYSREIYPHCGGEAVVWTLTNTYFADLPNVDIMDRPWASKFEFRYTTTLEDRNPEAIAWITTSGVSDIPYTWDADVKVFHINSEAGGLSGTTVEAYAVKSELRELGSAISGDYQAIGNTLMTDEIYDPGGPKRDTLWADSDAIADDIPATARVEKAVLFWSGWIEEVPEDIEFWDDCTDIDNGYWDYGGDWQQYQSGPTRAFYAHHGPGHRRLEMVNQIDLSGYGEGEVIASWQNWTYRNRQESDDCIQYAFGDSSGWGDWHDAFCGNFGTSPRDFNVIIPPEYLVADFKMRFQITSFSSSQEYCYIDNIKISAMGEVADTSVTFEIDGVQVYFEEDAYGNPTVPTIGNEEINASDWDVLENVTGSGQPNGYSYSSWLEVTGLVQEFTDNGNATYTVGAVDGDINNEWSYAAWSLIIMYASPETRGHQLYLYPDFIYSDMYCVVDFDDDGQRGGTISGFLVPDPIAGEEYAAKITCFIGEGDECYGAYQEGWDDLDFIALDVPTDDYNDDPWNIPNSYKLWDGTTGDSLNNAWNSKSLEISEDGIDIDTFYVPWGDPPTSGMLEPGETSVQVDLYTGVDSWNLIYIIFSFRSETVTGGTVTYLIWG